MADKLGKGVNAGLDRFAVVQKGNIEVLYSAQDLRRINAYVKLHCLSGEGIDIHRVTTTGRVGARCGAFRRNGDGEVVFCYHLMEANDADRSGRKI